MSEIEEVQRQLEKDEARYVGMIEASCVIYDRFGPFGPLRRLSGAWRAYKAIQEVARILAMQNERRRREQYSARRRKEVR